MSKTLLALANQTKSTTGHRPRPKQKGPSIPLAAGTPPTTDDVEVNVPEPEHKIEHKIEHQFTGISREQLKEDMEALFKPLSIDPITGKKKFDIEDETIIHTVDGMWLQSQMRDAQPKEIRDMFNKSIADQSKSLIAHLLGKLGKLRIGTSKIITHMEGIGLRPLFADKDVLKFVDKDMKGKIIGCSKCPPKTHERVKTFTQYVEHKKTHKAPKPVIDARLKRQGEALLDRGRSMVKGPHGKRSSSLPTARKAQEYVNQAYQTALSRINVFDQRHVTSSEEVKVAALVEWYHSNNELHTQAKKALDDKRGERQASIQETQKEKREHVAKKLRTPFEPSVTLETKKAISLALVRLNEEVNSRWQLRSMLVERIPKDRLQYEKKKAPDESRVVPHYDLPDELPALTSEQVEMINQSLTEWGLEVLRDGDN